MMELTTSLRLCREHGACEKQYGLLVKALGPDWGDDQPIPLTMLLDLDAGPGWLPTNNAIWALFAVSNNQKAVGRRVWRASVDRSIQGSDSPGDGNGTFPSTLRQLLAEEADRA